MKLKSNGCIRVVRCPVAAIAISLLFAGWTFASQQPVPQVDAGIGPCTADFTVSQPNQRPLYNAEISVRIAYGFMGMKKMDLKVGTNSEGRARFIGLPEKVHKPPLAFVIKAKGLRKTVNYWPSAKCHVAYSVIMGGR